MSPVMKYEEINKTKLIESLQELGDQVNELWEWNSTNAYRLTAYIDTYKSNVHYFEALKQNNPYGLAMNFEEIDRDAEWGKEIRAKTQRARDEAESRYYSARSHFHGEIDEMVRKIRTMIEKEEKGESPFPLGG